MKKKKIPTVEFVSSLPKMVDVFPKPEPASMNVPNWYKTQSSYFENDKSPKNGFQSLTIKKCMAITDAILAGYVLKAPCDIYIDTTLENEAKYEFPASFANLSRPLSGSHSEFQYSELFIDKDVYVRTLLRINMVWLVKTKPGYSSLFLNPMFSDQSPLYAIPGIVDTDTFYPTGLFSFLVKKDYKGIIKKGTPLLQVLPFKREDMTHKIVQDLDIGLKLTRQDLKIRTFFNSGYKKLFWNPKKYK